MRIRWTPPAANDMQAISEYLKEHNRRYRLPTMRKLYQKIGTLKDTPNIGRPGRTKALGRFYFLPYLISPFIALLTKRSKYGAFGTPHKEESRKAM
jgi:plasmid stabilization system protein ParE